MRRLLSILAMSAAALTLHGCTAMFGSLSYGSSDLYNSNNRVEVAERLRAEAEAERAEAEARRAQWEARQAEAEAQRAEAEYYASLNAEPNYSNIVANDYNSAYARRLYGFESPTYRMPSSYYDMATSAALTYATAYDPAYYNIMVSGNQVWVEPKYVTSMFGSWGATNITFGIYTSPWTYGWDYRVNPFYYSWWGYPRYSWYDWNWTMCYNPWHYHYDWWWNGYYDPYYHHHHHHNHYNPPRPPQYRPKPGHGHNDRPNGGHGHITGSGASSSPNYNLNGNRENTANRYTSPTTNRNYGTTTKVEGRPTNSSGSTMTGIYTGNDRVMSNGTNNSSTVNKTPTRVENSGNLSSGTTGTSSSGTSITRPNGSSNSSSSTTTGTGNFRQSTSTTRNSGTVSSGSSKSTSTSKSSGTKVSGGTTSTTRSSSGSLGSTASGITTRKSSSSSSSSFRSSSSSSSSSSRSTIGSSTSRSSSSGSFSSGSSSGSSSRSGGGGGSTSSRR